MAPRRNPDLRLHGAFDSIRFGPANILDLHSRLPSAADAAQRTEAWVRQRQVEGATEVLVITGRGKHSDGVSLVREAILRVILSLRRRGVVAKYEEHTAGSFSLRLASIQAMVHAPRRRREPHRAAPTSAPALGRLDDATTRMLRNLAQRSLEALGIKETAAFVDAEMIRQLAAIEAALPKGPHRDKQLHAAIRHALDQAP